ncbi:hypothetical protein GQ473_02550 [archaeon]|nr:hypothetical protein [archaeon]
MSEKLTPEEAIIKVSYPEDENINGSPLIVSQTIALSQIEHARQEERALFTKDIIFAINEKTRNNIEGHFYTGMFYGWITGFGAGGMLFIFPIYSVIVGTSLILVKKYFEKRAFKIFVTQTKKEVKNS